MPLIKLWLFFCGPLGWIAIAIINSNQRRRRAELEQAKKEPTTQ